MNVIEVFGAPASPYTQKILALLRYRRIPYQVFWSGLSDPPEGYPLPKVKLLPTVYLRSDDGLEALVDSTPIIQRLEKIHNDRTVQPESEVLQFLNLLIEDFADEWLTKAMFHYRWHFKKDAENAGPYLAYGQDPQFSSSDGKAMSDAFSQRQISRLPLVGSNQFTAPIIEASFQRLIGILDRIIQRQGFILGARPSSADFAIYGQLTQLGIVDPTSSELLIKISPRLRAWLDRVKDLSGQSAGPWIEDSTISEHLGELLTEIGRVYTPFLIANAEAAAQGKSEVETVIDQQRWIQPVFPYQVKCLQILRLARDNLNPTSRSMLDDSLVGTGCEHLF